MASDYAIKKKEHNDNLRDMNRKHTREARRLQQKQKTEIDQMRAEHEMQKEALKQQQHASINHIKLGNENQEREESLRHRRVMDEQRLQAQKDYQQLAAKKQRDTHQLKHSTLLEKQKLEQTKDHYRALREKNRNIGNRNLAQMEEDQRRAYQQRRSIHAHQHRSLIDGHNKRMEEGIHRSENQLKENRHKYMRKERVQKEIHQDQLKQNQDHFLSVKKRREGQYRHKLKSEEEFFQGQIKGQREEYKQMYKHNERANKASLENQQNRYEEELFKVRKDFVQNQKFYESRKSDPFYQLVDFGAMFEEGPGHYEVTAAVPEQEMENVRVHVQPEKISLYAARDHEQNYTKDNEKVSTNNAQTVKQEFSLAQPADHEKVVKSYQDGLLRITVPKKGFY